MAGRYNTRSYLKKLEQKELSLEEQRFALCLLTGLRSASVDILKSIEWKAAWNSFSRALLRRSIAKIEEILGLFDERIDQIKDFIDEAIQRKTQSILEEAASGSGPL